MPTCRLCKTLPIEPRAPAGYDICRDCSAKSGVKPLATPARPARPCMRCNHFEFVRVVPRELTNAMGHPTDVPTAAPMALTYLPMITENLIFPGASAHSPDVTQGRGHVETYVCLGCGFMEWYCVDPKAIPLGPEFMAERVTYTTDGPFR